MSGGVILPFEQRQEGIRFQAAMKNNSSRAVIWILFVLLALSLASAKPTEIKRQKRQSDQRIAELETLLALQKYGQHRLREWGRGRELAPPGYGLIDFDKIGRKKKSTRFSPGEDEGTPGWLSGPWIHPISHHHLSHFDLRTSSSNLPEGTEQVDSDQN